MRRHSHSSETAHPDHRCSLVEPRYDTNVRLANLANCDRDKHFKALLPPTLPAYIRLQISPQLALSHRQHIKASLA